jgi:hypothetical protein
MKSNITNVQYYDKINIVFNAKKEERNPHRTPETTTLKRFTELEGILLFPVPSMNRLNQTKQVLSNRARNMFSFVVLASSLGFPFFSIFMFLFTSINNFT